MTQRQYSRRSIDLPHDALVILTQESLWQMQRPRPVVEQPDVGRLQLAAKGLLVALPWCDCGEPAQVMLPDGTDLCADCYNARGEAEVEFDYGFDNAASDLRNVLEAMPACSAEGRTDRETLGMLVRGVWIAWAREQPEPKSSWLVPWDELGEPDREVDRRIGEAVAGYVERSCKEEAMPEKCPKCGRTSVSYCSACHVAMVSETERTAVEPDLLVEDDRERQILDRLDQSHVYAGAGMTTQAAEDVRYLAKRLALLRESVSEAGRKGGGA